MEASEQAFRFASDSRAAAAAREAVRSAAGDLPREALSDVLLCVTELVTNTVTHPEIDHDDELELSVARTPQALRVEVAERDRGVIVETAKRAPGDPAFGLYIVELLSDRWGVERGERRRIWFEKDLN